MEQQGFWSQAICLLLYLGHIAWRDRTLVLWPGIEPVPPAMGAQSFNHWTTTEVPVQFSSVTQSCPTLWPYWLQHARLPCPSPTPRACSKSCLSSQWCHPTISSSVVPYPPAFNLCQHQGLFQWVSSSHQVAKVLEFQLQHQSFQRIFMTVSFRIDWLGLLAVQGILKSLLQHRSSKVSILQRSAFFIVQLSHPYTTTGKTIALTGWTFVGKVMSLFLNMLSRFVITFLSRSNCLLILRQQSPSAVILEPKKIVCHCLHCFPIYLPWSYGTGCHDLMFWMLSFKTVFSISSFTFIKRLFSFSLFSAIRVVSSVYLKLLIFLPAIFLVLHPAQDFTWTYSAYVK